MKKKIRILVADDHAIVRFGLASLFGTQPDMEVIGQAEDGDEAVRLAEKLRPDIVIMDLMMPKLDGAAATALIREKQPDTRILILTSYGQSNDLARAVDAGAAGAISKTTQDSALVPTVRRVFAGERVFSPDIEKQLREVQPVPPLSSRQQEILDSLVLGHTNRDIATRIGIRTDSVEKYVKTLYQKLGAANRAEAVAIALRKHLLKSDDH